MKLTFFCPHWGSAEMVFSEFCSRVVDAGYAGVELLFDPDDPAQRDTYLEGIQAAGLEFTAQYWQPPESDRIRHLEECQRRLEWNATTQPLFINAHAGQDWFSFDKNQEIIEVIQDFSESSGIRILHETHRGRFGFCAAVTQWFLAANPIMRLTADFSHWCVVSESLLADQQEAVSAAIERADHIHARVGCPEGPQITDPRAPENQEALEAHLSWWDRIVEAHLKRGSKELTITPEFGPYPYMPEVPFSREPVASQWDTNVYMMELLRSRYSARCGSI